MAEEIKKEVVAKTTTKPKPVAKVEKKEKLSLKARLQKARIALKEIDMKRSGVGYTKAKYYTLEDMLPAVTRVAKEYEITPAFTFNNDTATLTIYDWYSDDVIVFESPMVAMSDSKMNAIQSLGSLETYQRRYLLQIAFDITDEDKEEKDTLAFHDIMAVKNRIEILMTDLMKGGYDIDEVIKLIGLKDEKQYLGYLSACGTLNTIEKNMRVLLNKKKGE